MRPVGLMVLSAATAVLMAEPAARQRASEPLRQASAPVTDVPRTPWGDPDLRGVWTNQTVTPLQRPVELGERATFTEQETARRDADARTRDREPLPEGATFDPLWWDRGRVLADRRASLIVDPPEGRVPPLTPDGERRAAAARTEDARGPEDRNLFERCIIRHDLPSSMTPGVYDSNYQIFQTPDYVVIQIEAVAHARIVPLDARPHLHPAIRQWHGDSRGRWEGDTLVVETTNLSGKTSYFGSGEHLRVVERFTRSGPTRIDYEITLDDPATFVRPWTVSIPLASQPGRLYEYACHEGNDPMINLLAAARAAGRGSGAPRETSDPREQN